MQLWWCVSFWFWQEIVLTFRTYLVYKTVVRLCQLFGCGRKFLSKQEHISTKKSYWVTLLWSDSRCVYKRPNTLLLCIFLFCIFLLYRKDVQVVVQNRILLKDKYRKLCQQCKQQQSHFDLLKNAYPVSLFWRNNMPAKTGLM